MKKYTYHPMHMHIHTCFQPGASMAMQMHNAKTLNMEYIWFTDHDTRTGFKKCPVTGFTFNTSNLIKFEDKDVFCGFEIAEFEQNAAFDYAIDTQEETLTLTAKANENEDWQSAGMYFVSSRTRHTHSLLMQVALQFQLLAQNVDKDRRLIFDVRLSQRPPECITAHMLYVLGDAEGLEAPHTQILTLKMQNGMVMMPLSEDVAEDENIGGTDNVFDTVTITLQVKNKAELSVTLKDFGIQVGRGFEDAHLAQKQKAEEVGKAYGIMPFVSFEVSEAGEHKNCFSSKVPTIDYRKYDYFVSPQEAAKHIKDHGGIFAFNHPLAITPLKRKTFITEERLKIIAKVAANLLANRAYGAELMEVGFPMGRNGFSAEDYLYLWDILSSGGLFLCGYGSSDSHRNNVNWFDGNNFAAYLGVSSELTYPVSEDNFVEALQKGRVYSGNPLKLKGAVTFETKDGHPMGTVFDSTKRTSLDIVFRAENVQPGWRFRLIENGWEVYSETLTEQVFTYHSKLQCNDETVSFQRAEFYDENDVCIMVTNPIYLVNTELFEGEIPTHRLPEGE